MSISFSQVSRFRVNLLGRSCCERVHDWLNNSSRPSLLNVRADGKSRWVRRNISTTSSSGIKSSNTTKSSSVLGGVVPNPISRIVDAESRTKIEPYGNLQQRLAEDKDLDKLVTVMVCDLETTGLDRVKERIIEIAVQDLAGGEHSTFQTLINPESVVIPITSYRCHGISNYMVRRPEVPRMEELIPIFLRYVKSRQKPGGYVMFVAHNGKGFDFRFLINEFKRCSHEIPKNWLLLDSLPLARETMKSVEAVVKPKSTLQALGEYYELSRDGQAHRALSDVLLLSQVFQRLTVDLKLSLRDLVLRSNTASEIADAMAITAMAKNKKT